MVDHARQIIKKMAEKEQENEATIAQDIVVTKYKMSGEMVNSMYFDP